MSIKGKNIFLVMEQNFPSEGTISLSYRDKRTFMLCCEISQLISMQDTIQRHTTVTA